MNSPPSTASPDHLPADARLVAADERGREAAACSLWWRNPPALDGHRLGLIGRFTATDAAAAGRLLDEACGELAARGCTLAVGPMDGSTWRDYRLVTGAGSEPPFFLEPWNPAAWPAYFAAAGFSPLATYASAVTDRLDGEDPKAQRAGQRLAARGVELRPLDPARWEDELREIHRLTTACFHGSFLYQPLPEPEFLARYQPLRELLRPELVLFAMHRGRAIGFVFNLPDLLQARRGEAVDTVILKTLAALPGRAYAGLGVWLTGETHRVASQLGYRRVIHALMHESNVSLNISARYGRIFRRYTLFSKPL
jgi:hypothetical protein